MYKLLRAHPRPQAALDGEPYDCWRDHEGGVALEFRRTAEGFHLRFPDRADFAVDLSTQRVTLHPADCEDTDTAADLFANQVTPLLSAYHGALVLHASAVCVDGAVLGFLGGTGRGKSTLATAFARRGFAFLSDDGLTLERTGDGYRALANVASVRLFADSQAELLGRAQPGPDHDGGKDRISAPELLPHHAGAAPLKALFVLGEPKSRDVAIEPLGAASAVDGLIAHSFMLDTTDRPRMTAHFKRVAELADTLPCMALDYPRDFAQLDAVVAAVVDRARSIRNQ